MADVVGRRWDFDLALFLAGVFIIAAKGSKDIYTYGGLSGIVGFVSGENVLVAATDYQRFVPTSGRWLLIILSAP